jgi:ribose-phosphate pyrophosphokinase
MKPLIIPLPGNEHLARALMQEIGGDIGALATRRFPDSETYLRYETSVAGRSVALLCTLDRPDDKLLPLLFAATAARDLQAARVGLIAPYLAYMRQDRRFQPGEAITSDYFARILSAWIDWLVTVDPHLHRHASLADIYRVPTRVAHAAPLISGWIRRNVDKALLIGPDSESEQWVAAVARDAGAPHLVLQKVRRGDRDVEVSVPDVARWRDHNPVLVDDIVATASTMIETLGHLQRAGMRQATCIAVHAIFAGTSYDDLLRAGAGRVVTTNTVLHKSNDIDVCKLIASDVNMLAI